MAIMVRPSLCPTTRACTTRGGKRLVVFYFFDKYQNERRKGHCTWARRHSRPVRWWAKGKIYEVYIWLLKFLLRVREFILCLMECGLVLLIIMVPFFFQSGLILGNVADNETDGNETGPSCQEWGENDESLLQGQRTVLQEEGHRQEKCKGVRKGSCRVRISITHNSTDDIVRRRLLM